MQNEGDGVVACLAVRVFGITDGEAGWEDGEVKSGPGCSWTLSTS